jgi:hypothetical protein
MSSAKKKPPCKSKGLPALLEVIMNNMKVEVHISALLIFICRDLGLFMTLKPCVVLLVIPPRLLLQLPCGQILLICPLQVKNKVLSKKNHKQPYEKSSMRHGYHPRHVYICTFALGLSQ